MHSICSLCYCSGEIFSFQGKPSAPTTKRTLAFILNSETIETVSWQLQFLIFEFMSVNIFGAILDNFAFVPQLDPAWLPGSLD